MGRVDKWHISNVKAWMENGSIQTENTKVHVDQLRVWRPEVHTGEHLEK